MTLSRALRRCAALAALLGIALQALWPLVAQARSGRSIPVAICSVAGSHRSGELPVDGGKNGKVAEHCKLCVLGGERPVLSSSCQVVLLAWTAAEVVAQHARESFRSSLRASAHPRAPPAFL